MTHQTGWRACRRCQGLISLHVPPGTCFDGEMHDFMYGADYRAVRDEFPTDVQGGWGPCVRCARLVCRFMAPGVCHDGAAHEFPEFGSEYGVHFGPDVGDNEPGWRWCNRCQCLNDAKNPSRRCFAGGDHDFGGSVDYNASVVTAGLQNEWMWCNRCQGLIHGFGEGICHDGDAHRLDAVTIYALPFGVVPEGSQPGWRLCTKCAGLTFEASPGACYAGDGHDHSSALVYSVLATEAVPPGAQPGWRWCSGCQLLSFSQFATGPCPAGGSHDQRASGAYSLYPESVFDGQPGWRHCATCGALTFTQLGPGPCRDGAAHDVSSSGWYTVPYVGLVDGTEPSWRRCGRCQVLTFTGGGTVAPCADGQPHDLTDSPVHGVVVELPPEDAQPGWRRCGRCRSLVLAPGDVPTGRCVDGGPHDVSGSPPYLVAHRPLAPSPAPVPDDRPRLTPTEGADAITVVGVGFVPGGTVEVAFRRGGKSLVLQVPVDGEGRFQVAVDDVVAHDAGASIVARQAGGLPVTARLRTFVPAVLAAPG